MDYALLSGVFGTEAAIFIYGLIAGFGAGFSLRAYLSKSPLDKQRFTCSKLVKHGYHPVPGFCKNGKLVRTLCSHKIKGRFDFKEATYCDKDGKKCELLKKFA